VCIALAKNPAGLNEVLRTIASDGEPLHLLVMLNDNVADGRDMSWIWDADVEALEGKVRHVIFAGTRAEDMALRFKYAGAIPHDPQAWLVEHDTRASFQSALAGTPAGSTLFVVPTYTAMLDVRSTMARLGHVREYWEE
jgi:UDP-N-acetylmuramyl tripeptide synthase